VALARRARTGMAKKAAQKTAAATTRPARSHKPKRSALPAKLTRPHASALLTRQRLFSQLDGPDAARWTWIGAPAGSGKTSLASGWIEARRYDCLWIQLDTGDADPASFFHYFIIAGLARAGRKRVQLTALTPEFLPGLELYARRFFEQLFGLYTESFVVVLDNFQEVPAEAPLSGVVLPALVDSLPTHGRLLCLSRTALPQTLTRQSMQPGFQQLGWEDLSLTDKEALQLAKTVGPSAVEVAADCNRWVRGWIAGVKLLLRAEPEELQRLISREDVAAQGLFDYYAQEVLERIPAQLRDFLQRAAVLSDMDAVTVADLTGRKDAAAVLAQLYTERLFIERRMLPSGPSYQFHPLFRSYLQDRLTRALTAAQIAAMKTRAAVSLEARGQLEAATLVALECDDPQQLVRLILAQAPQLVAQGRLLTLEHWLLAIPEQVRADNGWLLFWLGQSCLVRDLARSRASLELAYHQFRRTAEESGPWLALSAIICSHFLGWGSLPEDAWHWVKVFEALRADHGGVIPASIEPQIITMLTAMTGHCPEHVLSRHLGERARILAPRMTDPNQRAAIGAVAVGLLTWQGDEGAAWALIDELALGPINDLPVSVGSANYLHWHGILLWTASEHDRCFAELMRAREVTKRAGFGLMEPFLLAHLVLCALSAGEFGNAGAFLREGFQCLQPFQVHLTQLFRALHAMQLALAGQTEAGAAMARALRIAASIEDSSLTAAMERAFLTTGLLEGGALDEAERCGLEVLELAGRLPSDRWLFEGYMLLAGVELERGADGAALDRLTTALRLASRRNFRGGVSLWQPLRTAKLLALALRHGIEADYVKRLIRHRKIAPPREIGIGAIWPVRLRVAMLGRFGVWIEDQPLRIAKSAGRKPLELLKALIGLGAADISLATLGEHLWPELDGAAAHNACHVAIHRLRKLLGDESLIRIDHGLVALNWADAWADVEAFRRVASHIRKALAGGLRSRPEIEGLASQLLEAYPGHFLPGEERPWVIGVREQLRARFVHLAIELSTALERAGAMEASVALNRHGIELDPLAEAFHRGVIRGLIALERKAEAVQAYRHCRATLRAALHVEPSPETRELHSRIRQL